MGKTQLSGIKKILENSKLFHKQVVLRNIANQTLQLLFLCVEIQAIDADITCTGLEVSVEYFQQGAFSGTGSSHQPHHFT